MMEWLEQQICLHFVQIVAPERLMTNNVRFHWKPPGAMLLTAGRTELQKSQRF